MAQRGCHEKPCCGIRCVSPWSVAELRYEELGEGLFGAGLHRPVVMGALIGLVEKEGVEIRWGSRVQSARRLADGWEVEGRKFDLLLVADGARSAMRRDLLGDGFDRGYGWGAYWFIGKNHGVFPSGDLHQVVNGTRQLAGFLPTGTESAGGEELVSLFWSIRVADDIEIRGRSLEKWKEEVLELCPMAEDLLGQIDGRQDEGDLKIDPVHRVSAWVAQSHRSLMTRSSPPFPADAVRPGKV